MVRHDGLTDACGPQRDDEPAGLRRDIADELADHLACAVRRQQQQGDEDDAAERAAAERFGDPRAVARRLWLDAMKETIMNERIKLGLIAAACIAVCAMMWSMLQQDRQVNEAMLAHLASLAPAVKPMETEAELPLDWSEVNLTLVRAGIGGKPMDGASVNFIGKAFGDKILLHQLADAHGAVHFGPVRSGAYGVELTSSQGHKYGTSVVLYPGQREDYRVVCP